MIKTLKEILRIRATPTKDLLRKRGRLIKEIQDAGGIPSAGLENIKPDYWKEKERLDKENKELEKVRDKVLQEKQKK